MKSKPILKLANIEKSFPGCLANENINMEINPGKIHALMGENGAGKSTLVKQIYGLLRPDKGKIFWQGSSVQIDNPSSARALGICMVFQHFSLFEAMTTLENIALSLPNQDLDQLRNRLEKTTEEYGLQLSPDTYVYNLSMGERQRIEVVRCLLQKPKLLILDEPTSVLTPQETRTLFETLRKLASGGCAILYISHKLEEVRALCDHATILRNGKLISECIPNQETVESLAEKMIGKRIQISRKYESNCLGEERLMVKNLSSMSDQFHGTDIKKVNLLIRSGETLGIAGIAGNGQTELMNTLSGETGPPQKGEITINGIDVTNFNPIARRQTGAVFVPEKRIGQAAVSEFSLVKNSFLTTADRMKFLSKGMISWSKVKEYTEKVITQFNVKSTGINALASSLSGGNLQKFILGREILQNPKLIVISQPTWGVDAGAASAIHEQIKKLVKEGAAALIISQDLDEIFALSDRISVISEGTLSKPIPSSDITAKEIGILMGTKN